MASIVINSNTLDKDIRIKKEILRIKRILKNIDKNTIDSMESLIKNAAFMSVSLEELQNIINEVGYTTTYNNGGGQVGTKKTIELDIYITFIKQYEIVLKELMDLLPHEDLNITKDALLAFIKK